MVAPIILLMLTFFLLSCTDILCERCFHWNNSLMAESTTESTTVAAMPSASFSSPILVPAFVIVLENSRGKKFAYSCKQVKTGRRQKS